MSNRALVFASILLCASCQEGSETPVAATPVAPQVFPVPPGEFRVLANNDLGMHCMDREFSVFSILPPFNVVNAQVVYRRPNGTPQVLGPSQADLFYEPIADAHGSINSRSIGKTDFWQHVAALFGATLPPGQGVTGLWMPADAPQPGPQPLAWDAAAGVFHAFGVPITPIDDAGMTNAYPLMRIRARSPVGLPLGFTDVVMPVASETDCRNCHTTGGIAAVAAGVTWSTDTDLEVQAKENVLLLHDLRSGTSLFQHQPVLCASCHYSPPLDLAGAGPPPGAYDYSIPQEASVQPGHAKGVAKAMSRVMHAYHGLLVDGQGQPVFPPNGTALETCYQCHPGAITECLRGAMQTGGMDCASCHGDMLATGGVFALAPGGSIDGTNDGHGRRPWQDLPRCGSCHTGDALNHLVGGGTVPAADGIRLRQAWRTGDPAASAIAPSNLRFAENLNALYRFSKGHGGIACEGCHGSTHAEWPIADPSANDNVAASQIQGHTGTILECAACHANPIGNNLNGPHGMHAVGSQSWVEDHHDVYEHLGTASCRACHGQDLLGTVLSKTPVARTFQHDNHTYQLAAGQRVGCNACHSWPLED